MSIDGLLPAAVPADGEAADTSNLQKILLGLVVALKGGAPGDTLFAVLQTVATNLQDIENWLSLISSSAGITATNLGDIETILTNTNTQLAALNAHLLAMRTQNDTSNGHLSVIGTNLQDIENWLSLISSSAGITAANLGDIENILNQTNTHLLAMRAQNDTTHARWNTLNGHMANLVAETAANS